MGRSQTPETRAKISAARKEQIRQQKADKSLGQIVDDVELRVRALEAKYNKTPNSVFDKRYAFPTVPGYIDSSGAIRPLETVKGPWIASPIGPAETRAVAYGWVLLWLVQWLDWLWGRLS